MSAASCLVIVTSRKTLALDVEMDNISIRLSSLKPEHAIQLLRSIVPKLTVKQAEEISSLCGYLPLPIRIIGSTITNRQHGNIDQLIEQLKTNDDKRLAAFQTAFETYDGEISKYLFPLTLFPGSFDNLAAAALFEEPYDKAEDSLGALLESSVLEFDAHTTRYDFNDLLRLHARKTAEQETLPDQMKVWKRRFVNHYISVIQNATKQGTSSERKTQLIRLESHNLEACLNFTTTLGDAELLNTLNETMMGFLVGVERKRWAKLISSIQEKKEAPAATVLPEQKM